MSPGYPPAPPGLPPAPAAIPLGRLMAILIPIGAVLGALIGVANPSRSAEWDAFFWSFLRVPAFGVLGAGIGAVAAVVIHALSSDPWSKSQSTSRR